MYKHSDFRIAFSTLRAGNLTRGMSIVRFQVQATSAANSAKLDRFGEVLFYFTVQVTTKSDIKHLAYIQEFKSHREGRELKFVKQLPRLVIHAGWELELVGLISKEKEAQYFTRKAGSIWFTKIFDQYLYVFCLAPYFIRVADPKP